MQKLIPVENAKLLMREAAGWSVWGWLTEKRRLRTAADAAWEALEQLDREVKARWSPDLRTAWRSRNGNGLDPDLQVAMQRMKEAEARWREARTQAESTFAEAERRMSTSMACDGARQAIDAWVLTERAIRRAEMLARTAGHAASPGATR